jgi:3-hydroxyisobutyrate dehydrogenase-like beta-hydroxyacid dehydrogenase
MEMRGMKVGFVGLGRMGLAMAHNIAAAGHEVVAWNRSPVDARELGPVARAATPSDAFGGDAVFTMLSDDAAIDQVVLGPGLLRVAASGLVHVVTSTISVDFAGRLASAHRDAGIGYVSAPVFGRPDVAEAGQLNVIAAGASEAIAVVQPLLDAIGRKTFVMGDDPTRANVAKVAGNMMIAMAIEAIAEAVAITEAHGLARDTFVDLMTQTLFGGRAYENYGAKIVAGDYEAGFRLALGLKDLRLAGAAADAFGAALPMLDAVRTRMGEAEAAGMGDRDWSAIAAYTLDPKKGIQA